jgi:hypothetical protein
VVYFSRGEIPGFSILGDKMTEEVVENEVKREVAKTTAQRKKKTAETILEASPDPTVDATTALMLEKIMVKMVGGHSYHAEDVIFTKEDPFQLLDGGVANNLVQTQPYNFAYATKQMVEEFYKLG